MKVRKFTTGIFATNSYIVEDGESVFLIDAPDGNEKAAEALSQLGRLTAVLLTHAHFDHIMGLGNIIERFPSSPVYLAKEDYPLISDKEKGNTSFLSLFGIPLSSYVIPGNAVFLDYKDTIGPFRVIKTPGHTPGSVSLWAEKENLLFSGDTIFLSGEGRTDLGGNYADLRKSISGLFSLPDETVILPGHGQETSVQDEKRFTCYF